MVKKLICQRMLLKQRLLKSFAVDVFTKENLQLFSKLPGTYVLLALLVCFLVLMPVHFCLCSSFYLLTGLLRLLFHNGYGLVEDGTVKKVIASSFMIIFGIVGFYLGFSKYVFGGSLDLLVLTARVGIGLLTALVTAGLLFTYIRSIVTGPWHYSSHKR